MIAMTENESEKTDFELEWVFAQYEDGLSVAVIAKELGKSESYVYAHMKKRPEKYEDVKRIREENHNLRIRRIRGLADKVILEYMEKMSGQKDLGPADIDRANRISKDYDHRVMLVSEKRWNSLRLGGHRAFRGAYIGE
jgi:predicted transcriptional regulator